MNQKSVNRALDRLFKLLPDKVIPDKQLNKNTTFRVGGPARIFAVADSIHELHIIVGAAGDYELPLLLLGRGSNLLISDDGFPGMVLQLGREFQQHSVIGNEILSGAAVTLSNLVQTSLKHELQGLSFAIGIPGTLGAAVAINAGAYGSDMSGIVRQITIYTSDCRLKSLNHDEIGFYYRRTSLESRTIILEARLSLKTGRAEQIRSEMEINFRRRKESQPFGQPNAGSIFKNPDGAAAGKLIEEAGCKGWRIGGAEISEKHANFIINRGEASARDIYVLIKKVQSEVLAKSGVNLETEIKIVGHFDPV